MKRLIIITAIWYFLLLCTGTASAQASAIVTGETEYVKRGGYVDYTVSISGNTGISAYLIYVDCNTDVFSVDYDEAAQTYKVERGSKFQSGTIGCNVNDTRGYQVSWYDSNGYIEEDGSLFTLRFKASSTAKSGEYPVTIRYSEKNTLNQDMSRMPLTCVSGKIYVAPDQAFFSVETCEAVAGETFNLKVRLDENPGIASYYVYLLFDTSVFSATLKENGEGYQILSGEEFAGDNILCSAYQSSNYTGYRIQWWNSTDSIRPGTLFELPLTVSENARIGDYPIRIRISQADTTDEHGTSVAATLVDGTVTVKVEKWKDVSFSYNTQNKTATVSGTPCMTGASDSVTLIAASYAENGKMLACKVVSVSGTAPLQPQSFTLSCPDRNTTTVKLLALDGGTYAPICEAYLIETIQ